MNAGRGAPAPGEPVFVSRAGAKLRHALDRFALDVRGLVCADFGCSTGGFTDCLLQAGAARVASVDTGYGVLAWKLRQDPRVLVMERTNALHATLPEVLSPGVDLVVIDASWTPQRLVVASAVRWVRGPGRVVSLVKPHYEEQALATRHRGVLPDEVALEVARRVVDALPAVVLPATGRVLRVSGLVRSPIRGGRGGKRSAAKAEPVADDHGGGIAGGASDGAAHGASGRENDATPVPGDGNLEWLALLDVA